MPAFLSQYGVCTLEAMAHTNRLQGSRRETRWLGSSWQPRQRGSPPRRLAESTKLLICSCQFDCWRGNSMLRTRRVMELTTSNLGALGRCDTVEDYGDDPISLSRLTTTNTIATCSMYTSTYDSKLSVACLSTTSG